MRSASPPRPQRLPSDRGEESPADDTDSEQGSEQQHRVDTLSALTFPVNILKIEPQREFVQGQRSADTIEKRHQSSGPARSCALVRSKLKQPTVPDDQKKQNAPHEMMNVEPPDLYVVKRPAARTNAVRDNTDNRERQEKRNGRNQFALAVTPAEMFAVKVMNALPPSPDQAGKCKEGK